MFQIIFIFTLLAHNYYAQDGMGLIGDAVQSFAPCDEYVLSMYRVIGGRPQLENYWDGTFYLDKWPNVPEVRISLTVDNPAKIELDQDVGRVLVSGRTFHISAYDAPPKIDKVKFKIRGPAFGAFPNVEQITLNGLDVCKNPRKWKPAILGAGGNIGETEEISDRKQSTCGRRLLQHEGLIVNGFESNEGDWPWHAAIFHITNQKVGYKCGGSVLNSNTILTAAHCVQESYRPIISERVLVQLGKHNLKISGRHTQEFQVHKIVPHSDFDPDDLRNDIALIRLSTDATFNDYVQPICLWDSNKAAISEVTNKLGTVVGWGVTETDDLSVVLRQAAMPIVSLTTCLQSNRDFFGSFLSDKNFCAGFRNGTSVCNGDSVPNDMSVGTLTPDQVVYANSVWPQRSSNSTPFLQRLSELNPNVCLTTKDTGKLVSWCLSGGPIMFEEEGVYRIRGIVSLTVARRDKNVCNTKEYVVFTDVAQYLTWIEETNAQTDRAKPQSVIA